MTDLCSIVAHPNKFVRSMQTNNSSNEFSLGRKQKTVPDSLDVKKIERILFAQT